MKRLIGTFLAIFAIAFSFAAFAQHKTNSTYCYNHPEECKGGRQEAGNRLGKTGPINAHLNVFLPQDLFLVDRLKPTYPCGEDGVRINASPGYCSDVVSQGSGQRYVLRSSPQGDAAFLVHNGRPTRYVGMNGGSDSSGVAYLTPEAKQYAEQKGYRLDPRSNTMVAIDAPPQVTAQAPNDCSGKVMLEKIKCEALNNQTLRGSKHK